MPGPTTRFLDLLDLSAVAGSTSLIGPPSPERGGRVYGGQFLAQAVAACYRSVGEERRIHSLHAYFLRAGEVDEPTRWDIEEIREGRSFATRAVTGFQFDREVFRMTASFQTPEPGFAYGGPDPDPPMATVPTPDTVELSYVDFVRLHPDFDPGSWFGQDRPMEIRYVDPPAPDDHGSITDPQLTWTRITEPLPDDPVVADAALAYLSDSTLVDHVLLPHGHRWHDERLTGASLDHAMWFHQPSRPDAWLLYDQRVEATSGARGLATGRFRDAEGQLLATCTQEGLIRWSA